MAGSTSLAVCVVICCCLITVADSTRMCSGDTHPRRRLSEQQCSDILSTDIPPPVIPKRPHTLESTLPGAPPRTDPYHWLRSDDRTNTEVLNLVKAENNYSATVLSPTKPLQTTLVTEMLDRLPTEEQSTPQRYKSHYYYTIHKKGMQYRQHCRRLYTQPLNTPYSEFDTVDTTTNDNNPEQVLLDEDQLALSLAGGDEKNSYFDLTGLIVSPDERFIAYSIDTDGSERYTLYVKDTETGELILDGSSTGRSSRGRGAKRGGDGNGGDGRKRRLSVFEQTTGDVLFLEDSRTVVFATQTMDTHRPNRIWMYTLEDEEQSSKRATQPRLIYEEEDEAFHLSVWLSRSENVVFLRGRSEVTHYLYYMPANSSSASGNNNNNDNGESVEVEYFTRLVPAIQERQYIVRDNGDDVLYAVVYTPEERNGFLIVTQLKEDALVLVEKEEEEEIEGGKEKDSITVEKKKEEEQKQDDTTDSTTQQQVEDDDDGDGSSSEENNRSSSSPDPPPPSSPDDDATSPADDTTTNTPTEEDEEDDIDQENSSSSDDNATSTTTPASPLNDDDDENNNNNSSNAADEYDYKDDDMDVDNDDDDYVQEQKQKPGEEAREGGEGNRRGRIGLEDDDNNSDQQQQDDDDDDDSSSSTQQKDDEEDTNSDTPTDTDTTKTTEASEAATSTTSSYWVVLQQHNRHVEIVDITLSTTHLAVLERKNGTLVVTAYKLPKLTSTNNNKDNSDDDDSSSSSSSSTENPSEPQNTPSAPALTLLPEGKTFSFDDPSFALYFGDQGSFTSSILRVQYTSLTQPISTYDINMHTGNRVLKQQQRIIGYDSSLYHSQLVWANSYDGTKVPISMVYRRDAVTLDGSDALLLEAYGAYGATNDASFSGARLSLLDRGFVFAIAHVRGGGELGQYWYQEGKLLKKRNTFLDLEAAASFLIQNRYTSASKLCLWGRSAGGLTIGATINSRPDLFTAAILDVPFVDIVSTMSDPTLPLTVIEWDEWGDPVHNASAYEYMLDYSPVDTVVQGKKYPNVLVTVGLNDPRVPYWEGVKYVAHLRDSQNGSDNDSESDETSGSSSDDDGASKNEKQVDNEQETLKLLVVNMGAGHFASSGLEDRLAELAMKYAFLLNIVAPCKNHTQSVVTQQSQQTEDTCENCFAVFGFLMTAVALTTLFFVFRPRSRDHHHSTGEEVHPNTNGFMNTAGGGYTSNHQQNRIHGISSMGGSSSSSGTVGGGSGGSGFSLQSVKNLLMGNKRYYRADTDEGVQMTSMR